MPFINAHFDNIVSLANLDDGQSKAINDLSKSVNENTDLTTVREKSKKIYEISGMNPEAIEFYFSFTKDLKNRFKYDQNDLVEVIQADLKARGDNEQSKNGRVKIWLLEYACGIWCAAETRENVGDMDKSYQRVYYAGCLNGCVFGPNE
jgi:hypothetical protein